MKRFDSITKVLLLSAFVCLIATGCKTWVGRKADSLLYKREVVKPAEKATIDNVATNELQSIVKELQEKGVSVQGTNWTTLNVTNAQTGEVVVERIAALEVEKPEEVKYVANKAVGRTVGSIAAWTGIPGAGMIGGLITTVLTGIGAYRTAKRRGEALAGTLVETIEEVRRTAKEELDSFNQNEEKQLNADAFDRKLVGVMKATHRAAGMASKVGDLVEKVTGKRNLRVHTT